MDDDWLEKGNKLLAVCEVAAESKTFSNNFKVKNL